METVKYHTPESLVLFVHSYKAKIRNIVLKTYRAYSRDYIDEIIFQFIERIYKKNVSNFIVGKEFAPIILSIKRMVIDNINVNKKNNIIPLDEKWAIKCTPFEELDERQSDVIVRKNLRKMIRNCPKSYKEILTLRYIFKMKYDEISDYQMKPLGTIKFNLKKAVDYLKETKKSKNIIDKNELPEIKPVKILVNTIDYVEQSRQNYLKSIFGENYEIDKMAKAIAI